MASRIEYRTRRDESELWEGQDNSPEERLWRENDVTYLDFLTNIIPARAALEAAGIQASTNRSLVNETRRLASVTRWLAGATIVLAVAGLVTAVVAIWG